MKVATKVLLAFSVGSVVNAAETAGGTDCTDDTCLNEEAALLQVQRKDVGNKRGPWMIAYGFVPYYTYTGNLAVKGAVTFRPSSNDPGSLAQDGVLLGWSLSGVDPRCEKGKAFNVSNSCGVHIHAGTSCSDNAEGHYWNSAALAYDPWGCIGYTSWSAWGSDRTIMSNVQVLDGFEFSEIEGHTFIVHDFDGGRIACAIINTPGKKKSKDAGCDLETCIEGKHDGTLDAEMDTCMQEEAFKACESENGEGCEEAVGPRPPRPRRDQYCATNFVPYFSYTGSLRPSGMVKIQDDGVIGPRSQTSLDGQRLSWSLKGLDPDCAQGPDPDINGNSCGVHIHEGTDCTSNAGPHYWNSDAINTDPWGCISSTSTPDAPYSSTTSKKSGIPVLSGYTLKEVLGRTIILHDYLGGRIACAEIKQCAR